MTGNQMFCRENELDESFKQLASYINIPVGVLLPFKSQCFVRHYNKGHKLSTIRLMKPRIFTYS